MEEKSNVELHTQYTEKALKLLVAQMELLYRESIRTTNREEVVALTEAMNKIAQTIAWGHETNAMLYRPMQWTV